jgi:Protein of unknown function (DUF3105)
VPVPILGILAVLLLVAPLLMAVTHSAKSAPAHSARPLEQVVRRADCRLSEFQGDPGSNPPVSGRVDERVTARDGSYVGRTAPSTLAATHALLHGRVVVQYRPSVSATEIERLDRLVRRDPTGALLFENRTNMPQPVAAAAYLTLMTCPRVDARTIEALQAFRDRRSNFGQAF